MTQEGMTFGQVLNVTAETPELVREFDRLCGTHLATIGTRAPIDRMIDEATGRERDEVMKFAAFVFEFVWLPLLS